jgi:pimeloyl-ACP methyl ester carboxylesterase
VIREAVASGRIWKTIRAADVNTALDLDSPNPDSKRLFANAKVPIREINSGPPLSSATNIIENRNYADYDVIIINDAGHFIPLERPQEFNQALTRWLDSLTK